MNFRVNIFVFFILAINLAACAIQKSNLIAYEPVKTTEITPLTATFKTSVHNTTGSEQSFIWKLIRSANKIEVLREDTAQSEIWSRTSNDLWYYEKAFHEDRTVVQYSPVDLKTLGIQPQWLNAATAINPKILQALSPGHAGKNFFGFLSTKYTGPVGHTDYTVIWLKDVALPAQIIQVNEEHKIKTQLLNIEPLSQFNTPFTNLISYRLIDYSDLGDMERDPFVKKIQHSLPASHAHVH